jgi:hypothetical protein
MAEGLGDGLIRNSFAATRTLLANGRPTAARKLFDSPAFATGQALHTAAKPFSETPQVPCADLDAQLTEKPDWIKFFGVRGRGLCGAFPGLIFLDV